MKPSLPIPASRAIPPVRSASAEPSATARCGSPSAATNGRIVAAIIGPSEESGPSMRIRDGPKNAYPSRQRIEVYKPVIAGSPASSA
jgi:hypothetical protein